MNLADKGKYLNLNDVCLGVLLFSKQDGDKPSRNGTTLQNSASKRQTVPSLFTYRRI